MENNNTKPFNNVTVPNDWKIPKFGQVFDFLKTYSFSREPLREQKTDHEIQNIHYGDIHSTFEKEILDFEYEKAVPYLMDGLIDKTLFEDDDFPDLKDGDLIIADASEDYEGICDCVELKNTNRRKILRIIKTYKSCSDI